LGNWYLTKGETCAYCYKQSYEKGIFQGVYVFVLFALAFLPVQT